MLKNIISYGKHHKKLLFLGSIMLLVLIYFLRPKTPPPPPTQTIQRENFVQSVAVSGTVTAKRQADLSFIASGTLVYLGAKKDDTVTAGQTIAVLDQRTVLKNMQTALFNYVEQRNTFDQTNDNNKNTPLTDSVARVLQNNQYDLNKSVVSVELQDLARQQSVLTTPISGILTREDATTTGSTVTTTTIFSVVDPASLVFAMDVDEADIGKIQQGQKVHVNLDAYADETLTYPVSTIDFVSHTTSNGGNAFTVEIKLPSDQKHRYRVGMNGNAEIITAEENNVLTVPLASIFDTNAVYVKTNSGYEKKRIKLGLQNDTDVIVVEGLQAGDRVVLDPTKVPSKQGIGGA